MELGWIDFSREDRNKALNVINLLSEDGTLDELGIAPIRDGFADIFFPGTSTIQTRAKYFLIVPYAINGIIRKSYSSSQDLRKALDMEELECAKILNQPGVEGVIGSRALQSGGWVQRPPVDVYWAGIRRFEIFRGGSMSLSEYLRTSVAMSKSKKEIKKQGSRNDDFNEGDDVDAGSFYSKSFWKLPNYHIKDDPTSWKKNLTMDLSNIEAEFLKQQIIETQPKSLLALILEKDLKQALSIQNFDGMEGMLIQFPFEMQENYYLARDFSNFIYLARIRYNIILSQGKNQEAVKAWDMHKQELDKYYDVNLNEIFNKLEIPKGGLWSFLISLQECFKNSDINKADQLIIQRETGLKGYNRAKLNFPGKYPLDNWLGGKHLEYRFGNAMVIIRDIFNGLEGNDA